MKTYPYHTPDGIIQLVEKRELDQLVERLAKAEELLREIRDDEVNAQDEADRFLRDHQPSELAKMRAANAELLERLAEARESHLAASARDVQTIQRQAIMLEKLAAALKEIAWIKETGQRDYSLTGDIAFAAFSAYESANLEPVANPIDEAVKRMEAVPWKELDLAWDYARGGFKESVNAIRAILIRAAKGEQI